jgi:hypothetical protein
VGVALSISTDAPYAASKLCLGRRWIVNSRFIFSLDTREKKTPEPFGPGSSFFLTIGTTMM